MSFRELWRFWLACWPAGLLAPGGLLGGSWWAPGELLVGSWWVSKWAPPQAWTKMMVLFDFLDRIGEGVGCLTFWRFLCSWGPQRPEQKMLLLLVFLIGEVMKVFAALHFEWFLRISLQFSTNFPRFLAAFLTSLILALKKHIFWPLRGAFWEEKILLCLFQKKCKKVEISWRLHDFKGFCLFFVFFFCPFLGAQQAPRHPAHWKPMNSPLISRKNVGGNVLLQITADNQQSNLFLVPPRWVSDECQMSFRWVSDEFLMSFRWVVDEFQMSFGWVSDEFQMSFRGVLDEF